MTHICGELCPHDSDCAVHNAPALPVGACDCVPGLTAELTRITDALQRRIALWQPGEKPEWGECGSSDYGQWESNGASCAEWYCADELRGILDGGTTR